MERENAWVSYSEAEENQLEQLCKGYREFLDKGKTERECVKEIIEQAKGKIWTCYSYNDEKTAQIEEKYKVTSKQFVEGGVKYKILSEEKPFEDAEIAEISLEDGYIYMNMKN